MPPPSPGPGRTLSPPCPLRPLHTWALLRSALPPDVTYLEYSSCAHTHARMAYTPNPRARPPLPQPPPRPPKPPHGCHRRARPAPSPQSPKSARCGPPTPHLEALLPRALLPHAGAAPLVAGVPHRRHVAAEHLEKRLLVRDAQLGRRQLVLERPARMEVRAHVPQVRVYIRSRRNRHPYRARQLRGCGGGVLAFGAQLLVKG